MFLAHLYFVCTFVATALYRVVISLDSVPHLGGKFPDKETWLIEKMAWGLCESN